MVNPDIGTVSAPYIQSHARLYKLPAKIHVSFYTPGISRFQITVPDKISQYASDFFLIFFKKCQIKECYNLALKHQTDRLWKFLFDILTDRIGRQVLLVQIGKLQKQAQIGMLAVPAIYR